MFSHQTSQAAVSLHESLRQTFFQLQLEWFQHFGFGHCQAALNLSPWENIGIMPGTLKLFLEKGHLNEMPNVCPVWWKGCKTESKCESRNVDEKCNVHPGSLHGQTQARVTVKNRTINEVINPFWSMMKSRVSSAWLTSAMCPTVPLAFHLPHFVPRDPTFRAPDVSHHEARVHLMLQSHLPQRVLTQDGLL